MRRILHGLGIGAGALFAALAVTFALARYADGPIGPFPGGPLSGPVAGDPRPDWSALAERDSLEVQVNPEDPRSLTTWLLVVDGGLYVPSGLAESKRWPREVVADGRVVLRVGELLYERQAVRVVDPELRASLHAELRRKYAVPAEDDPRTWYFRMDPRPSS